MLPYIINEQGDEMSDPGDETTPEPVEPVENGEVEGNDEDSDTDDGEDEVVV